MGFCMNKLLISALLTVSVIGCSENPVSQPDIQEKNGVQTEESSNYTIIEGSTVYSCTDKDTVFFTPDTYRSGFIMYEKQNTEGWTNYKDIIFNFENGYMAFIGCTLDSKYTITLFK